MAFRRFSRSEESSSHPTPPRMVGEGEIGECGSPKRKPRAVLCSDWVAAALDVR
jgi:hypothetical protein